MSNSLEPNTRVYYRVKYNSGGIIRVADTFYGESAYDNAEKAIIMWNNSMPQAKYYLFEVVESEELVP